jgi:hypothetical protein
MKKSLLIKSAGLYCINFGLVDRAIKQAGMTSYRILLFNDKFQDPMFILYYKELANLDVAYRSILSILEGKRPGKVIKVNFRKE